MVLLLTLFVCCCCFAYKTKADSGTLIELLDIPVNAVATALKDFFSKRLPSLFSKDIIKELEEIAGKYLCYNIINCKLLIINVFNNYFRFTWCCWLNKSKC